MLRLLPHSHRIGLARSTVLANTVPPVDLLLFCEDRFDALDQLKIGSVVVQPSIGAGPSPRSQWCSIIAWSEDDQHGHSDVGCQEQTKGSKDQSLVHGRTPLFSGHLEHVPPELTR